jgi:hypothetical protein
MIAIHHCQSELSQDKTTAFSSLAIVTVALVVAGHDQHFGFWQSDLKNASLIIALLDTMSPVKHTTASGFAEQIAIARSHGWLPGLSEMCRSRIRSSSPS